MQKHCKEQCGGHCPCSLDSELGDESRKLEWGDISLIADASTKNEVILWTGERGSKTRYGESARAFNPTAQATSNERCPVNYYKSFKSHQPEEMLTPDSPFFLAITLQGFASTTVTAT